jgi:hypothetical protein
MGHDTFLLVRFQVLTATKMKMASSEMLRRVARQKLAEVSEVFTASIIRASTSVNFY